jgi:hypothetical protein
MMIDKIPGTTQPAPHTFLKKNPILARGGGSKSTGYLSNFSNTSQWISEIFMVWDLTAAIDEDKTVNLDKRNSYINAKLGLGGPWGQCYYPALGWNEYYEIIASGSTGRWMHNNKSRVSKGNYIKF